MADALRKMDGELRDGWPALSLLQKAGLASPALSPAAWKKATAAEWDESAHPRDERGRFADKAGTGTPATSGDGLAEALREPAEAGASSSGSERLQVTDARPANTMVSGDESTKQWKQAWIGQPNEAMRNFLAGREDRQGAAAFSYGYEQDNSETHALGRGGLPVILSRRRLPPACPPVPTARSDRRPGRTGARARTACAPGGRTA